MRTEEATPPFDSAPRGRGASRTLPVRQACARIKTSYQASLLPPLRKIAAALALVSLIALNVIVILVFRVGPALISDGAGHGLHALDIVVLCGTVPICVYLLHYLDRS
jgi:hypothetical protein